MWQLRSLSDRLGKRLFLKSSRSLLLPAGLSATPGLDAAAVNFVSKELDDPNIVAVVKPFLYLATASAPGAADKTLLDIRAPNCKFVDEPEIDKTIGQFCFNLPLAYVKRTEKKKLMNLPRVAVKEGGGVKDPVRPKGLGAAVTVPNAP